MNKTNNFLLSLLLALALPVTADEIPPQIQVSGVGKVSAAPDMAHISFSFSERATSAAPAREKSIVRSQNYSRSQKNFASRKRMSKPRGYKFILNTITNIIDVWWAIVSPAMFASRCVISTNM